MSATTPTIIALCALLVVALAILITLTEGLRRHRLGATAIACWTVAALTIFSLKAAGQPLPKWLYGHWLWPLGVLCGTWALWDVSRLSRLYGTSTLMSAAEIARGFLHSPVASESIWSAWANGLPTAAWLKSKNGVMLAINRHYETAYGKPSTAYTGAPDGDVWPAMVANEFRDNDVEVYSLGAPVIIQEPAPTWANPKRRAMILKFPVRNAQGDIVSVGGIELTHPMAREPDDHEDGK